MNVPCFPELAFQPSPWIDGRWGEGGDAVTVVNPATGASLATVHLADEIGLQQAIDGAWQRLRGWQGVSAISRGQILQRVAGLLLERKRPLARLLTAEQGKPFSQAVAEVEYAASFFQWYGEATRRIYGRIVPHPDVGREFLVQPKALGVVGLITPWNFPLAQGAKKLAAALAAGCTAVWKPAAATPLIALALAPILQEAGVLDGAVQIVPAPGPLAGAVLTSHPQVRGLSLTGSTATGSSLMAAAAPGLQRVSLELGGNAPFIILPDADLDWVAEQLLRLKLLVSGQVCVTANRVFVDERQVPVLAAKLADRLRGIRIGDGLCEGVEAGPLIHAQACAGVQALVEQAVAQGARIVAKNESYIDEPALRAGSFFPVLVMTGVEDSMALAREEIFGPVIPLIGYRGVREVIERANATPYGLAAYVYGRDPWNCRAVAEQLEVGIVGVNEWRPLRAEIPFGGVKKSGFGAEGGEEGLDEFLEKQVISLPKPTIAHPA
jgi:succinate-semialdehyde dehydrogenase/glutarate-semialdehyde dehydrogenase